MINYSPFFKTLKKKKISQYQLMSKYLISSSIINRIKNEKSISLSTVETLCKVLHCDAKDIFTIS